MILRVLLLLTALVVTGCSSDNEKAAAPTTTTTILLSDATTAPPQIKGGFPSTPEKAAEQLRKAWESNDRPGAAKVATTAAIEQLFRTPYQSDFKFQACEPNPGFEGKLDCAFTYEGGSAHFIMKKEATGYSIESVQYVAD